MSKPILKRSEVAEKDTWNLGDIFASDELWRSEYENLKAAPESILKYRGRLGESAGLLDISPAAAEEGRKPFFLCPYVNRIGRRFLMQR